jgi:hypothetical protein
MVFAQGRSLWKPPTLRPKREDTGFISRQSVRVPRAVLPALLSHGSRLPPERNFYAEATGY